MASHVSEEQSIVASIITDIEYTPRGFLQGLTPSTVKRKRGRRVGRGHDAIICVAHKITKTIAIWGDPLCASIV